MKGHKKSWADAVLWTFVVALLITGGVHALALVVPNMLTSGSARQMSAFERLASRASQFWLDNALWMAAVVAAGSFLLVLPLFLRRVKASNQRDIGAEAALPPPGHS